MKELLFVALLFVTTPAAAGGSLGIGQETPEPGEADLIEGIKQEMVGILQRQYPPGTRTVPRDEHPKTFGVVAAEFIVLDDIPESMRYGVFKTPKKYDALIRFSAGGHEVKPDTAREARGMAIKLLGVSGDKLIPAELHEKTQDFIMINFPAFTVQNLKDYIEFFAADASGAVARTAYLKKHPDIDKRIKEMGSQVLNNPLQAQYWSEVPYRLGPGAMKFSASPVSRRGDPAPVDAGPDFLREVLLKQVQNEDVYFDFLVQLQTDAKAMPIENPMVIWSEVASPFHRVAIIRIPRQDPTAFSDLEYAESLSFTPWHALPEQRPLGSMNRARLPIYEALSTFRHSLNGLQRSEPAELPRAH